MSETLTADGTIYPSRFVTPSNDFRVVQSVLGDCPSGISSEAPFNAPITGATGEAADLDDPLLVYHNGDQCLLELAETVVAGAFVMPDANGKGIAMDNTSSDSVGARTIFGGAAGEKVLVEVTCQKGS